MQGLGHLPPERGTLAMEYAMLRTMCAPAWSDPLPTSVRFHLDSVPSVRCAAMKGKKRNRISRQTQAAIGHSTPYAPLFLFMQHVHACVSAPTGYSHSYSLTRLQYTLRDVRFCCFFLCWVQQCTGTSPRRQWVAWWTVFVMLNSYDRRPLAPSLLGTLSM